MNFHITRINGMPHGSAAYQAQNDMADIALTMGFKDIAVYKYDSTQESNESLNVRFDGMIAGIERGDIVIVQLPTWHETRFDDRFVDKLKLYGARVIIFIHDVPAWMFEASASMLGSYVSTYNKAECLIVPSANMKERLINAGVRSDMKFVIQDIFDYITDIEFRDKPLFKKEVHLAAGVSDFEMLPEWKGNILLKLYAAKSPDIQKENIQYMGFYEKAPLLYELHKGGFGLLWGRNQYWHDYLKLNNSFKLSNYIAAGVPLIVPKGVSNEEMITKNHLGIVVESLKEAVSVVENMTEEEYYGYVEAVERFAPLIRKGMFARKYLAEAIHMTLRDDLVEKRDNPMVYNCEFDYAVAHESYGNKVAVSWHIIGEADFVRIIECNTKKVLWEGKDEYEHTATLDENSFSDFIELHALKKSGDGFDVVGKSYKIQRTKLLKNNSVPEVSVIVPCYNGESYLAKCLDSILASDYVNYEIVVVNDGSTDKTEEIAKWYQERYSQVTLYNKENGGISSARNYGMDHAKGKYLSFVDSDDKIWPFYISKLYRAISKEDSDVSLCRAWSINAKSRTLLFVYQYEDMEVIDGNEFFERFARFNFRRPEVWNKMYKREFIKNYPFDTLVFEDLGWTPVVLSYAKSVGFVDDILYDYDCTENESSLLKLSKRKTDDERFEDIKEGVRTFLCKGNPERRESLLIAANNYIDDFGGAVDELKEEFREEISKM